MSVLPFVLPRRQRPTWVFGRFRQKATRPVWWRLRNQIVQSPEFNKLRFEIVGDVSSLRIVVSWLTDTAGVHKILFAGFDFEFGIRAAAHHGILDEGDRDVRVSEETNGRLLMREMTGGH